MYLFHHYCRRVELDYNEHQNWFFMTLFQLALEEELESFRDSSERVERKQEEVVSRLTSEFEAKEKHW